MGIFTKSITAKNRLCIANMGSMVVFVRLPPLLVEILLLSLTRTDKMDLALDTCTANMRGVLSFTPTRDLERQGTSGCALNGKALKHYTLIVGTPPLSQNLAVKDFCFVSRGICGGFFVKFLAANFPGNSSTKIDKMFRQDSAAFSAHVSKMFCQIFALGDYDHDKRKPQKGVHDNFCLHLWDLWMPHLKCLFHYSRQKCYNTKAIETLHLMSVCVVVPCGIPSEERLGTWSVMPSIDHFLESSMPASE